MPEFEINKDKMTLKIEKMPQGKPRSSKSLGDILAAATNGAKKSFMYNTTGVPEYFQNDRTLVVESASFYARVKKYRTDNNVSLPEAKRRVETLVLIEMMNQAVDMNDIEKIRLWAMCNIYPQSGQ